MSLQLIFVSFLENQSCPDADFQEELKSLVESLNEDENLETDGPNSSKQPPPVVLPGLDDDLCRKIGARLAEMGDQFDREGKIDPIVVQGLVDAMVQGTLTEDRFSAAVHSVLDKLPPGIEQEKACLTIAMNLTSKVGRNVPALLHTCFSTAISFIQRNCLSSVQALGQQIISASAVIRRKCLNSPDSFCYICGSFTVPAQRTNISAFVRRAYSAYFNVKIAHQEKCWAPHKVCKQCVEGLRMWTKGTRHKLPFGVPMIWREPRDHPSDCYFCIVKTSGYNKKNKYKIEYPNLASAMRPVPHCADVPVPVFTELPSLDIEDSAYAGDRSDDDSAHKRFDQHELNDLTRDLGLSKEASELLASRLRQKNLLK